MIISNIYLKKAKNFTLGIANWRYSEILKKILFKLLSYFVIMYKGENNENI